MKIKKSYTSSTIFDYYDDESSGAIELSRLLRNVRYHGNPSEIKSILVTSATKHEGKSLIAAHLAIAMSKRDINRQILLIDCDLRRPVLHSLFGIERAPGFSSLLAGEMEANEVARDTELPNLKVVPTGYFMDSPSQLLGNAKDALSKCKDQSDILICDAPPVVPVDDTAMLSPHLDGILMVVMAGKTDRMVVKRAIDILKDAKAEVLGIVLNNLHGMLPYYYDYGYYGYRRKTKELPRGDT